MWTVNFSLKTVRFLQKKTIKFDMKNFLNCSSYNFEMFLVQINNYIPSCKDYENFECVLKFFLLIKFIIFVIIILSVAVHLISCCSL